MKIVVDNTTDLPDREALKMVAKIILKGDIGGQYLPMDRHKTAKGVWYTVTSVVTSKGYQFRIRTSLLQNV